MDSSGARGEGPAPSPFPRALWKALREAAPEGAILRLGLRSGETSVLRRIVAETADGLLGEADSAPGATETALVAIPWDAILRAEAQAAPGRRARPGFHPGPG